MTIAKPKTITMYFLSLVFLLIDKAIAVSTNNEHVILDDIAYNIASMNIPPLKFRAIVICLSIASKILKIGYKYPGITQKIIIITEITDIRIVLFICFCAKISGKFVDILWILGQ